MPGVKPDGPSAHGTIDVTKIYSPSDVANSEALKICVKDAEYAKAWITGRYFHIRWIEADILYQSPPMLKTWEGTTIPRANISRFTVANHVNGVLNVLYNGLFYEEPPFHIRPRPKTSLDTTRAITSVISYQLDEMNFRQESKFGLFCALLNGTGIWKWGWKEYYEDEVKFRPVAQPVQFQDEAGYDHELVTEESDKFVKEVIPVLHARPSIEAIDIRYVLVEPGCRVPDIRGAKYVIHEIAATYKDLIKWKDEEYYDEDGNKHKRYDLPSEGEIRGWFEPPAAVPQPMGTIGEAYANNTNFIQHAAPRFEKTTVDPLDEPLDVLERWDNDKVITVLNKVKVIRNEPNPFGKIPFFSVNWWMIQDTFWGMGFGWVVGADQRVEQGMDNAAVDITTLHANAPILRRRAQNVSAQPVRARLGGFIEVDVNPGENVRNAYAPMELPQVPASMFQILQVATSRSEQNTGANEVLTQGGTPFKGKTSLGRSATGAGGMMSAVASRLGGIIEDFNRQVFQPWLWQIHELNRQFLPPSVYRRILNEELEQALKVSFQDYLSAGIKEFEVLAGSHLVIRQQMAQSVPLVMQYLTNPALLEQLAEINQEYIDVSEIIHMLTDSAAMGGGAYSVVKKLTPEMIKRMQDKANAKAQQQEAQNNQKFNQKAQLQDQEWTARAAGDIIRHSLETAGMGEAIEGEPTEEPGFGGSESAG